MHWVCLEPWTTVTSGFAVQEVQDIVAANTPVYYLHPEDQFNPCTVEWFLDRSQLCSMTTTRLRKVVSKGTLPRASNVCQVCNLTAPRGLRVVVCKRAS